MVPLFNAALNKRVAAKLWKQPLTKKASKSGLSRISAIDAQLSERPLPAPLSVLTCA